LWKRSLSRRSESEGLKQRIAVLEKDNAALRAQIPDKQEMSGDTVRVLLHLFKTDEMDDRDVGVMARAMNMERSVLAYHLERLADNSLAENTGFNTLSGAVHWALTSQGRRYVVERKLI
jgi:ActR/RegA family two-component response regulator